MPSLEIVCVGQAKPSDFSHFPFKVESENKLVSHRTPKPLFQADFDQFSGCIYHLLDEGGVTAYDLLRRDWYGEDEAETNVEFRDEYAPFVQEMLEKLLSESPNGQFLFTTDYQFGPQPCQKHGPMSLAEFWQFHLPRRN